MIAAIYGYGNLGRGVEAAINQNDDMELVAVFTRRNPDELVIKNQTAKVCNVKDMADWKDKIDVMILCGGSATDLPEQTPECAKYFNVIDSFDIDSIIYPKYLTADYILQYVRARQNTIGCNVETLYKILDGRAEALEFSIKEDSAVTNVPLMDLNLKDNLLICCINRNGQILTPRGQNMIMVGDTVILVTTNRGLGDIRDILKS